MANSKAQLRTINIVFSYLAVIAAIVLLVIGGLALWTSRFTTNMVRSELSAQKVYFPKKGDPAINPIEFPDLQKYAGQLVDTPEEAHAYANGFIGRHLKKVANGKVYAEISAEAQKDPSNMKLQQQKQTLFQGETLRGILLTSGYGFGTVGVVAGIAAIVAFVGAAALLLLAGLFKLRSATNA